MADKLKAEHKRFVEELVKCGNQTEAYMRVYPDSSRAAAGVSAHELLKNPKVAAYRDKLQSKLANKRIASAEEVLETLTAGMRGELTTKDGKDMQINDIVRCAELIGKRYGLFRDKIDVKSSISIADTLKAARERAKRNG